METLHSQKPDLSVTSPPSTPLGPRSHPEQVQLRRTQSESPPLAQTLRSKPLVSPTSPTRSYSLSPQSPEICRCPVTPPSSPLGPAKVSSPRASQSLSERVCQKCNKRRRISYPNSPTKFPRSPTTPVKHISSQSNSTTSAAVSAATPSVIRKPLIDPTTPLDGTFLTVHLLPGFAMHPKFPQLLDLSGCPVNNKSLLVVLDLKLLRGLSLSQCRFFDSAYLDRIRDSSIRFLTSLPHLKYLNLESTSITDCGVSIASNILDLQYLNLNRTKVSNEFLKPVASLPSTHSELG
ncbi:hypothetical protein Pelo_6579 [Pelomyxa schiedti]|nr:hypothetical protein Pelo_6579 [Pelomyxa schiedti]